jgi:hypothetical protein
MRRSTMPARHHAPPRSAPPCSRRVARSCRQPFMPPRHRHSLIPNVGKSSAGMVGRNTLSYRDTVTASDVRHAGERLLCYVATQTTPLVAPPNRLTDHGDWGCPTPHSAPLNATAPTETNQSTSRATPDGQGASSLSPVPTVQPQLGTFQWAPACRTTLQPTPGTRSWNSL